MNELAKIFKNSRFGELQVITDENGDPWFIADEVCKALELGHTPTAVKRLADYEKNTIVYSIPQRGNPTRTIVNESGLYSLILSSRKKEAKEFKRWVTCEVLPSIRRKIIYF